MKNETIAIIGSTGKTGARVMTQLNERGYTTRGLSRHSEQAFDWGNKDGWKNALEGVHTAYVTYYPDLAVPQAESDIRALVELAKALDIKHIVLLSGRGEEGAQRAEKIVMNSGLQWNVVRASWFMQNFSESFMLDDIKTGTLVLPEHTAIEPFIDVDDIADVAVAALTQADLHNQLFEITGPELLSFSHCVQSIGAASKRDIGLLTVPIDAYLANGKANGMPEDVAWLINELFVNVLDGRNESITDTVEKVLGRPARRFQNYVSMTAQTGVWAGLSTESRN